MKKYKFMTIKAEPGEAFGGKPVYHITNNKTGVLLGMIFYYKAWKSFVFRAKDDDCIFDTKCLLDIIDFIDNHAK